jgi:hypothetical protein
MRPTSRAASQRILASSAAALARTRNLRPTEGARFLLERKVDVTPVRTSDPSIDGAGAVTSSDAADETSSDATDAATDAPTDAKPTRATYRAAIYTPEGEFATTATLAEDGTVILDGATGAPGDLDDRLKNIAKLVARDAPKRRDDGLVVWPARIMRWRK